MAKSKNMQWVWVTIIAVLFVGAIIGGSQLLSVADQEEEIGETDVSQGAPRAEFCTQNPDLDLELRVRDMLASTKSYMNATVLMQDLDSGAIQELDVDDATGDYVTFSDALDCLNPEGYAFYIKGDDPVNSNGVFRIEAEDLNRGTIQHTFETSKFGHFQLKVYDEDDRSEVEEISSGSTEYTTNTTAEFGPFDGSSADALDVSIDLRPVTNGEAFGEMMYIAIDTEDESNLADWDEALTTVMYNGEELSEATGLSENELRAMNAQEHIYALPESIGVDADGNKVQESLLRVMLEPEADETSNDYDVTIKFIARGDVESTETDEVLENVGFEDDSSRTALYTAQTATLVVN